MLKEMNRLVDVIKDEYPNLYVDLEYDEEENLFEIWYNNEELRTDKKFGEFIGKLVYELYNKDIFNFYIDYNEDRTNEIDNYLNFLKEHPVFENPVNPFDTIIEESSGELNIMDDTIESRKHYDVDSNNYKKHCINQEKEIDINTGKHKHLSKYTYEKAA